MNPTSLTTAVLLRVAFLSGVCAHLFFNRLEPRKPFVWLALLFGFPVLLFVTVLDEFGHLSVLASLIVLHLLFLTLSVVLYRISPFHPLAKFPGPCIARITALYMGRAMLGGKRHIKITELHKTYGTHVRIGPNMISVVESGAIRDCLGSQGMPRAAFYYLSEHDPGHLINSAAIGFPNHVQEHARKRKLWNRALGGEAIKEYDVRLERRSELLVKRLGDQRGVVDFSKWIGYFTFDFMGDIVFGGGFEMLRNGRDTDRFWSIVEDSIHALNITRSFDWIGQVLSYIPTGKDLQRVIKFAEDLVELRSKKDLLSKDIIYYLTEEGNDRREGDTAAPHRELIDELFLAILAGSDTTSSVIANIFYSLLTTPSSLRTLREEVDTEFGNEYPMDGSRLAKLRYLDAVIHEGLRLYPAVPFSNGRTPEKGSGGKLVAGKFIPEGTTIYLPPYAYQRDPRYFYPDPDAFRPERWIDNGTKSANDVSMLNIDAFNPFSYGPGNCVGKHLAYRSMRIVIARLVHKYDMSFEEGYDPNIYLGELSDDAVFVKGRLPLLFTSRK